MSLTTTRRESITFASLLAFLAGGLSGVILSLVFCFALLLFQGCSALGVSSRTTNDGTESCVVIKLPSALRVCQHDSPQPEEAQ